MKETPFANLDDLVAHLRSELENKKYILLYAYNGIGKTRLSMAFKEAGKKKVERPFRAGDRAGQALMSEETQSDTLYFNAFTEDLFTWDNDLDGDSERVLKINKKSHFFDGLESMEMDNRIRPLLQRYADFDFRIDTSEWVVRFSRKVIERVDGKDIERTVDNIKVSRGEENIFIWCFFLAIVQLVLDDDKAEGPYQWVKYIYIDDPISSLDEHNAIAVANHLAQLLKAHSGELRTVISTHHTLFFNVLHNELGKANRYFLSRSRRTGGYDVRDAGDTPFFHHLALLQDIWQAKESGQIYTHHFNALRSLLEKASIFHGHKKFSVCIEGQENDPDGTFYGRLVNILSHGNYSFYDPVELLPENKEHFGKILDDFLDFYSFNPELTPASHEQDMTS